MSLMSLMSQDKPPIRAVVYTDGCQRALAAIKERLLRGLLLLSEHYTLAAELLWFRLACRSCRIIARLSAASDDVGRAFCDSPIGEWYRDLQWPTPSLAARGVEW